MLCVSALVSRKWKEAVERMAEAQMARDGTKPGRRIVKLPIGLREPRSRPFARSPLKSNRPKKARLPKPKMGTLTHKLLPRAR